MDFNQIRDLLEAATEPTRLQDGLVFKALHGHQGVWSNQIGSDDVWHRQDAHDTAAYEPPPHYTTSFDEVLEEIDGELQLTVLRQHVRADANRNDKTWRPWHAEMLDKQTLQVSQGAGVTPGMAATAALMASMAKRADKQEQV